MKSFQSLGIRAPILSALADCGYQEPTLIQEKAIPAGLAGRDVLGSAQTGTGKTCAFGVPILQRLVKAGKGTDIRALILTPTRELAIQIDENLKAYGKNLPLTEAVIFGGVGQAPQVEQLKKGVDILTATPGRLLDLAGQGLLDLSHVSIFVLDEADRMLDMGFIHDVRRVIKLLPEKKQTMFFSATLPPEILDLVDTLLHDPVKVAAAPVSSPVEVIRQEVCLVDRGNKTNLLAFLLEEEQVKNALVFTRTKHGADKVARDLVKRGVAAAAIHGNKSQTARQESLRRFKAGELQVLVATDIAARGLDIEELSHVFNYNLSEVPETYIHRIGRTGRAGHGGTAISFCDYGELPMLKDIEKLLKKPVPRREHPFPMEVFEVPKKDAKGRPVNPEDAEARQAAREKNAARKQQAAEKAAQSQAEPAQEKPGKKKKKKAKAQAEVPAPEPAPEKVRRTFPHGKQNRGDLQAFLDSQPQEAAPVVFAHRNPLEGDVIMDATARLLASKPVYQYYKPPKAEHHASQGKKKKGKKEGALKEEAAPKVSLPAEKAGKAHHRQGPKKGVPAPLNKTHSKRSNRGRIPPRVEPPKSRQKDSTEQKSLMKPFYIDHD
ncbi:MAG: DEAD/DEAH box helicase [Evtepia sp.]